MAHQATHFPDMKNAKMYIKYVLMELQDFREWRKTAKVQRWIAYSMSMSRFILLF